MVKERCTMNVSSDRGRVTAIPSFVELLVSTNSVGMRVCF